MRIIKFLLSSLLILTLLTGIVFLLLREILLSLAINQVKNDLSYAQRVYNSPGSFLTDCRNKGIIDANLSPIQAVQLRFTSSNNYSLELTCSQFTLEPIVIRNASLPWQVNKIPGTSGYVLNKGGFVSGFAIWGRQKQLAWGEGETVSTGPITNCVGYGYSCCQEETQLGVGEIATGVTDCVKTGYRACQARPVILSFTTLPFYDAKSRSLEIANNTQVEFAFVADLAGVENPEYILTFGDGQQEIFTNTEDKIQHLYQCHQTDCIYQANLQIKAGEMSSFLSPVSQIKILVKAN